MLVRFSNNDIINTLRIDSVAKLTDNRLLVHVGDRQIRLDLTMDKFLEMCKPRYNVELLTEGS